MLGLDPDPARLWPRALELAYQPEAPPAARAAFAVATHCQLAIEAAGDQCVAVKLQVACFERLGAPGWAALEEVVDRARERGLLVIADAKRGDIDLTATVYAQAYFGVTPTPYGPVEGLEVDAMTVNPLLGVDSLEPFVREARPRGGGLFVLARTTNPGAADVQGQTLEGGGTISDRLAQIIAGLGADGVGATAPEQLSALREQMPKAVFLLPGIGPQGRRVEDLGAAFAPGPAAGLVSASRAIVAAHERSGGDPASAARQEAERLRELAWAVSS